MNSGADSSVAPTCAERILAIRAGALGDTILALPALAALGSRSEGLELVGTMPHVELARGRGLAVRVHSIDRALFRGFFTEGSDHGELSSFLAQFDLVVAWARLPRLTDQLRRLGIALIEAPPHPPEGVHASDHLVRTLAPLGPLGLTEPARFPSIELDPGAPRLGLRAGNFLALHPSSGSPRKNWPPERFLELARLARRARLDVLWIQGEADVEVVGALERELPAPVASCLPLRALATVLSRAAAFVGNDSGVSHLAAAVGAPTLSLFGPTDPRQWAPRGRVASVGSIAATPSEVWAFARELMIRR